MAKKWHTRGSHAISSGVAVATLVTAGIAAASQGGVVGVIGGRSDSGDAQAETRVVAPSSASRTIVRDDDGTVVGDGSAPGGAVRAGSIPVIPGSCENAIASVRDSLPAQGDNPGIQQAIAVVSANCADASQAQGLLTALEHLLSNQGSGASAPGNGGKGHPNGGGPGSGKGQGFGGGSGQGQGSGGGSGPGSGQGAGAGGGTGSGGGSGGGSGKGGGPGK